MSLYVGDRQVCTFGWKQVWMFPGWIFPFKPADLTVACIGWHVPDVILMQLILLMMSTVVLETC